MCAQGVPVSCVTFGSPRVGNCDFAKEFDKAVGVQFRVVHKTDPMTKVPMEGRCARCPSDLHACCCVPLVTCCSSLVCVGHLRSGCGGCHHDVES